MTTREDFQSHWPKAGGISIPICGINSQVDDWNPFGGAFLLLMLFALTYTFVCKYSAHRSEEVTSKAPNLDLQVCGRGSKNHDFGWTSFMDGPLRFLGP